jgi:hypothetical protein
MAAEAFNSVGGYTVNIPPITIVDSNGNITSNRATIADLTVTNDILCYGNITANDFYGNVHGNITANIIITGANGGLLYNNGGTAEATGTLSFDNANSSLNVDGALSANTFALGSGVNQFYEISSLLATTTSTTANQVLHRTVAGGIVGVDYTVIATDTVSTIRQISKLDGIVLGSDVEYSEFGTAITPYGSPEVGDFKVLFESGGPSGNVVLVVTPGSAHHTEYKIMVTKFKA